MSLNVYYFFFKVRNKNCPNGTYIQRHTVLHKKKGFLTKIDKLVWTQRKLVGVSDVRARTTIKFSWQHLVQTLQR